MLYFCGYWAPVKSITNQYKAYNLAINHCFFEKRLQTRLIAITSKSDCVPSKAGQSSRLHDRIRENFQVVDSGQAGCTFCSCTSATPTPPTNCAYATPKSVENVVLTKCFASLHIRVGYMHKIKRWTDLILTQFKVRLWLLSGHTW